MRTTLLLGVFVLALFFPTTARMQTSGRTYWETESLTELRELLKVPPSAQFKLVPSKSLPDADPLKICLATIDNPAVRDALVGWVGKWNKDKGRKYGAIEVVADPTLADVSIFRVTGPSLFLPSEQNGKEQIVDAKVALLVRRPPDVEVWAYWIQTVLASEYKAPSLDIGGRIERRMKERAKDKPK